MVEVAVIILTMNQRDKTMRCLSSFRAVKSSPYRIVLWDNGSQDRTVEAVHQAFPEVITQYHPRNIGVASGRNAAAKIAIGNLDPTYLFFLDNDMTVTPGFLEPLIEPFEKDDLLAQTTGKIRTMDATERLYGAGGCRVNFLLGDTRHIGHGEIDRGQYDKPAKCVPSGGCMLVRTDIFQQLGGFDAVFDPYGPEDLDFGLRAARAGYYGLYVPQAVVFHETRPGRTFEGGQYTARFARHRVGNWFELMRRHASVLQKLGFAIVGVPTLLIGFILRQSKRGALTSSLLALARGIWEYCRSRLKSGATRETLKR